MNHSTTFVSTLFISSKTSVFEDEKCLFGCGFYPSFSRLKFTGKELDEETGYGYFGARYMDHELMTGWLSVDPMSDKYPSLSPYNYCAWNPIRLIDPDGNDWYDLFDDGTLNRNGDKSEEQEYKNHDVIYSKRTGKLSNEYTLGTIGSVKNNDILTYKQDGETKTVTGQRFTITGNADAAKEIFEFCASNSPYVEYSLIESSQNELGEGIYYLTTSRKREGDSYGGVWGLLMASKGKFLSHTHNHPGKSSEFSKEDKWFYDKATEFVQKATNSKLTPAFKIFIFIDKYKGGVYHEYKDD